MNEKDPEQIEEKDTEPVQEPEEPEKDDLDSLKAEFEALKTEFQQLKEQIQSKESQEPENTAAEDASDPVLETAKEKMRYAALEAYAVPLSDELLNLFDPSNYLNVSDDEKGARFGEFTAERKFIEDLERVIEAVAMFCINAKNAGREPQSIANNGMTVIGLHTDNPDVWDEPQTHTPRKLNNSIFK